MKRHDQGYLHPKLKVPILICPGRESNPGASAVGGKNSRKKPFEQIVNSYSEHLNMSPRKNLHFELSHTENKGRLLFCNAPKIAWQSPIRIHVRFSEEPVESG